jgi:ATP phosphoribosyltransferase regulatory subunit
MAPSLEQALLPEGLQDTLPPDAQREAAVARSLLDSFTGYGYDRVSPPLIEFEENFVGGAVKQRSPAMVRAVDPVSQRMLAIRSDFTPQVARIATTRLQAEPRPLRLCYAGPVVRARGSQLRPEREFTQVGCELFGFAGVTAEMEVILMAAQALKAVGVSGLTIDLVTPTLVPAICDSLGLSADDAALAREALQAKDAGALKSLGGTAADMLRRLLDVAGPADEAIAQLGGLALPAAAQAIANDLADLVRQLGRRLDDMVLTVDPGEYLNFEYHSGIAFSIFARKVRGELGRGGRYTAAAGTEQAEDAVGFTAFLDSVMRAVPAGNGQRLAYLPQSEDRSAATRLRGEGWRVIEALTPEDEPEMSAAKFGCSHIIRNGAIHDLSE